MESTNKVLALIREAECIGCAKCIAVCPVDAILGTRKKMHTVIADECIGCKLCLPPCPVDCIDLVNKTLPRSSPEVRQNEVRQVKERVAARRQRLSALAALAAEKELDVSLSKARKNYIEAAVARVKKRK